MNWKQIIKIEWKQTKAPVTNAKAEWRKKPKIAKTSMDKDGSRDLDEEGNQEDAVADDDALGDSFDHSGGQNQSPSKSKNNENQLKQSGTGIRFESDSQWYLWLQTESLDHLLVLIRWMK